MPRLPPVTSATLSCNVIAIPFANDLKPRRRIAMFRFMGTSLTAALAVGLAIMGAIAAAPTAAQSYPQRPIRVIVPLAAGGQTDVVARLIAQKLSESLGQPVIIDNRSGAGGLTGTETAVRAAPDGYTLLLAASTYSSNAALYKLSYDPIKDVESIALV